MRLVEKVDVSVLQTKGGMRISGCMAEILYLALQKEERQ